MTLQFGVGGCVAVVGVRGRNLEISRMSCSQGREGWLRRDRGSFFAHGVESGAGYVCMCVCACVCVCGPLVETCCSCFFCGPQQFGSVSGCSSGSVPCFILIWSPPRLCMSCAAVRRSSFNFLPSNPSDVLPRPKSFHHSIQY